MNKRKFCSLGKSIDTYLEKRDKYADATRKFCEGSDMCFPGEYLVDEITGLMSDAMDDMADLVPCFVFERPLKLLVGKEKKKVVIDTYEKLYDFMQNENNS